MLDERGPPEDPTILLTGMTSIGGAAVQIVAIRVDPSLRWTPDYRADVDEDFYRADGLADLVEGAIEDLDSVAAEFRDALGDGGSDMVTLAGQSYRVWLVSAATDR